MIRESPWAVVAFPTSAVPVLILQLFCAEGDQKGEGVGAEIFKEAFKPRVFNE